MDGRTGGGMVELGGNNGIGRAGGLQDTTSMTSLQLGFGPRVPFPWAAGVKFQGPNQSSPCVAH